MGAAEGSIIATIMPAHIRKTAPSVAQPQLAEKGIISRMKGCAMSSVIQATKAQLAASNKANTVNRSARASARRITVSAVMDQAA